MSESPRLNTRSGEARGSSDGGAATGIGLGQLSGPKSDMFLRSDLLVLVM